MGSPKNLDPGRPLDGRGYVSWRSRVAVVIPVVRVGGAALVVCLSVVLRVGVSWVLCGDEGMDGRMDNTSGHSTTIPGLPLGE